MYKLVKQLDNSIGNDQLEEYTGKAVILLVEELAKPKLYKGAYWVLLKCVARQCELRAAQVHNEIVKKGESYGAITE